MTTTELAKELFHPLKDLIDAHVSGVLKNDITDSCYYDKEFDKVYRVFQRLLLGAEIRGLEYENRTMAWNRITILKDELENLGKKE